MSTLREAAQQALEALEMSRRFVYADNRPQCDDAIEALRAALKQEEEAAAWLAERKDHWRKEREKAQAAKDKDPELSAALGWPGGIRNPVLDRKRLLQMVAALRVSAQQALDSINELFAAEQSEGGERGGHIRTPATREHLVRVAQARRALHESCDTLRAALAQPDDWTRCHHCGQTMPPVPLEQAEPDISRCPQCNGPADNGHDRSIPPSPYLCTSCMAEPVQEPVTTLGYAARKIVELIAQRDALLETLKYIAKQFRQHGRQHWPEAVAARLAIEAVEGEKT